MNIDIVKCCILSLVFSMLLIVIRAVKGEIALPLSLCISVAIASAALATVYPVYEYLKEMTSHIGSEYMALLLKALGIALITSTSAELCRDSGENGVASKIELFGKCQLISLALPLLKRITEMLGEVMSL